MRIQKRKRIVFVADPLENMNPENESTLVLMREGQRRHYTILHCLPSDISIHKNQVTALCSELRLSSKKYKVLSQKIINLQELRGIFLRKDPPFDLGYVEHLQILSLISDSVPIWNRPESVLKAAEKIWPLKYAELCPETLISANFEELSDFAQKFVQGVIIKPLGLAGGAQIFQVNAKQMMNLKNLCAILSHNFSRPMVMQEFLPKVKQGDKRILLWKGEILGAFLRIAAPSSHLSNLHAGGRAKACKINKNDRKIVDTIRDDLINEGLDLVGLDVIGGKLTEVNVTSAMGLAEIKQLYGLSAESLIFDRL